MASDVAVPPAPPAPPESAPPPQRKTSGRDGRNISKGPVLVVVGAVVVTAVAVGWLVVGGSGDGATEPDAVEVVAAAPADDLQQPVAGSSAEDPASDDVGDGSDATAVAGYEPAGESETPSGGVTDEAAAMEPAADDQPTAGTGDSVAADDAGVVGDGVESGEQPVGGATESDRVATETTGTTAAVGADADAEAADLQPQSRALFRDGQVILFGKVPTREIADEIFDLAASVLGPENVVDEYEIDPSVPPPTTGNLTVEETIEFGSGTAVLPDPVPAILPVGVALMTARPTADLRLIGHTDSRGSEAANVELSLARAEAVKAFFVVNGIDPDRIETVGAGESRPVASNDTDEGRRENRRIEFEVSNILGEG